MDDEKDRQPMALTIDSSGGDAWDIPADLAIVGPLVIERAKHRDITIAARLDRAIEARRLRLGKTRSGYFADLARADLDEAGVDVTSVEWDS